MSEIMIHKSDGYSSPASWYSWGGILSRPYDIIYPFLAVSTSQDRVSVFQVHVP